MNYKKITLILFSGIFLSGERIAQAQTAAFNYVDTLPQSWTVPACVTQVTIQMWGGGGAGGYQNGYSGSSHWSGGSGAYMEGVLSGIEGKVLTLYVPQGGNYYTLNPYAPGGWPGGGKAGADVNFHEWGGAGGGYAAVKVDTTYYALAGAGGGGGSCSYGGTAYGGGGGNPNAVITNGSLGSNGGPGLLGSGGAVGTNYNACDNGTVGKHLMGGSGGGFSCSSEYGGGGGGAGWYGGGGGGDAGNAGGGGSSFPGATYSFNGITFTILSNLAGTTNSGTCCSAVAPGSPPAGIGAGNYSGAGGNGYILITYAPGFVQVTDTPHVIYQVDCNGGTDGKACAYVTGGTPPTYSYNWMPGGATTDTVNNLSAGTYTVTVSNTCGSTATAVVTLTQPGVLNATASVINNVLCNSGSNGSAFAVASGGSSLSQYTYLWTPSNETTDTAIGLSAGTYVVLVSDPCGGTASATVTTTQPAAMDITASAYSNVSCYGLNNGSVQSSVSGGAMPYTYMWAPGGANTDTMGQLTAGIYTLTVTDANGCSNSAAVAVTQPNLLTASVSPVTEVACNGAATGVIQSTIAGGTNPYTYSWTGGKTTANANNVRAGSYTLTVIDSNGCMATATTIVTQPTALNIIQNVTVDSGSCTGSAWVIVTGGVYAYSYLWNNGNSTYYVHYACGGKNYCCVVTDGHGCIDSACVDMLDVAGVATVNSNTSNITVYPNPTSGQFTVSLQGMSGNWKIEMYNLLGEQVYSGALNNAGANTQVNMGNQPAGVYLYRVLNSADGHLGGEGKVVLQK